CLLRGEELFLQAKPYAEADKADVAAPLLLKALTEFDKIRDKGKLRLRAALTIGKCYLYMHQYRDAESAFGFVADSDPNNVDAHRGLASLYYDLGVTSRA